MFKTQYNKIIFFFFLGILRLYTFIEWVKEVLASEETLRKGSTDSFTDTVFIR